MPYRQTVVFEYANIDAAPSVGSDTRDFGPARVVSVQFSDALAELQVLLEDASEEAKDRAFYASNHGWDPAGWDDLRGKAPQATGMLSSEAFVRKSRDEWDQGELPTLPKQEL